MGKLTVAPETPLQRLLFDVEDRCNRAVAVLNVAARAVEGDAHGLRDDDGGQRLLAAALERIAEELNSVAERAALEHRHPAVA
jgi:hypothetical protein